MTAFGYARLLALLVPATLLAGALGSQYVGGLQPWEMCHGQRWPHYAALAAALAAFAAGGGRAARPLVLSAALLILLSGAIGVFHAGVEYGWWKGLTRCAAVSASGSGAASASIASAVCRCHNWRRGRAMPV